MLSRKMRPIRLSRCAKPFDSEQFIYELKIDGFRSLAYIENGQCELISRNGNTFHNFKDLAQWIGEHLRVENAVMDGEIACVDLGGQSKPAICGHLRTGHFQRRGDDVFYSLACG